MTNGLSHHITFRISGLHDGITGIVQALNIRPFHDDHNIFFRNDKIHATTFSSHTFFDHITKVYDLPAKNPYKD